jgi:membrane-bound lytic murein transglycosylase B
VPWSRRDKDGDGDGNGGGRRNPGSLGRAVGLVAVVLLAASTGSMDTTAAVDAPRAERTEEPVRHQESRGVGADGDTPPTAAPPPSAGRIERRAPAGDGREVALAPGSAAGIPVSVLAAYRHAAAVLERSLADCNLPMTLLAAIGKVESGHARGGRVDSRGNTTRAILGPVLDGGPGMAAIRDTDGGRLDGNTAWDRAVGPMQFIPGTWSRWATDGNADGIANPHNVFDASMAGGRYLCADGRDLATGSGLDTAVLSYNRSTAYLRLVRAWMSVYEGGATAVPDGTGVAPPDRTGEGGGSVARPGTPSPSTPPGTGAPEPPGSPTPTTPPGATPPTGGTPPPAPTPPGMPGLPALPDPLAGVGCVVQGVIGVGAGLIGGLIGLPPPPQLPPCPMTSTPPPPPPPPP